MTVFARSALLAAAGILALAPLARAADADAAQALARQNNCLKCHALDKDKEGPSFKKMAQKNKGKPDAETRMVTRLTTAEMVKFADGHEEEHKVIRTSPPKDLAQVRNLVQWILAQ